MPLVSFIKENEYSPAKIEKNPKKKNTNDSAIAFANGGQIIDRIKADNHRMNNEKPSAGFVVVSVT